MPPSTLIIPHNNNSSLPSLITYSYHKLPFVTSTLHFYRSFPLAPTEVGPNPSSTCPFLALSRAPRRRESARARRGDNPLSSHSIRPLHSGAVGFRLHCICICFPLSSKAEAEAEEDMAAALISPAGAWLTKPQVQWSSGGGGAASSSLDSDLRGPGDVKFGQRRAGGALVSCGRKGVARAVGGAVDLSPPASAPPSTQVQEGLVILTHSSCFFRK